MRRVGIWSDHELLKIWLGESPRSIFPNRRIGRSADGYEASFLVLDRDPSENLRAINCIRLRVKQDAFLNNLGVRSTAKVSGPRVQDLQPLNRVQHPGIVGDRASVIPDRGRRVSRCELGLGEPVRSKKRSRKKLDVRFQDAHRLRYAAGRGQRCDNRKSQPIAPFITTTSPSCVRVLSYSWSEPPLRPSRARLPDRCAAGSPPFQQPPPCSFPTACGTALRTGRRDKLQSTRGVSRSSVYTIPWRLAATPTPLVEKGDSRIHYPKGAPAYR